MFLFFFVDSYTFITSFSTFYIRFICNLFSFDFIYIFRLSEIPSSLWNSLFSQLRITIFNISGLPILLRLEIHLYLYFYILLTFFIRVDSIVTFWNRVERGNDSVYQFILFFLRIYLFKYVCVYILYLVYLLSYCNVRRHHEDFWNILT